MWHGIYTFTDGEGHKSTAELHLASATTYAQANAVAVALGAALTPLIDGKITRVQIAEDLGIPAGGLSVPAALSEVEIKMAASFRTSGGFVYRFSVPTFNRADFMLPNSDNVDQEDGNVSTLLDIFTVGVDVAGTNIFPRDSRAETLTSVISVKEAWGKKRRAS